MDTTRTASLDAVLRRDRVFVLVSLAGVVMLASLYLLDLVWHDGIRAAVSPLGRTWRAADFAATAMMWITMMVGMMLPSAAPFVLLYALVDRQWRAGAGLAGRVVLLVAGYLSMWIFFALAATAMQEWLAEHALSSPNVAAVGPYVGGAYFIFAGLYEWAPTKRNCLRHCHSPLRFVMEQYRPGAFAAFRMGTMHGVLCIGCCWALALLMFVGGIVNLVWVAVLAVVMLVQKTWREGESLSWASGAGLMAIGAFLLVRAL